MGGRPQRERVCVNLKLTPGSGGSPGEGTGYPLQYSRASLVAQLVKKPPPVMWETQVPSLGWEGPLKERMATCSSILAWRIPMDRGAWWATVHGVTKTRTGLRGEAQRSIADSRVYSGNRRNIIKQLFSNLKKINSIEAINKKKKEVDKLPIM